MWGGREFQDEIVQGKKEFWNKFVRDFNNQIELDDLSLSVA